MDLNIYGGSQPFDWTHEYLLQILTTGRTPVLTNPIHINAFVRVDRGDFVPEDHIALAYKDKDIPLAYNEILTSPFKLAHLINIANPRPGDNILEIGAGTGYLAAILAEIAGRSGHVYGVERIQWLWEQARKNTKLYDRYQNIDILYRDGSRGLESKAPYDVIFISTILPTVENALIDQLKEGGRLLIPTEEHTVRMITKEKGTEQGSRARGEGFYSDSRQPTTDSLIEEIIPDISSLGFGPAKNGIA